MDDWRLPYKVNLLVMIKLILLSGPNQHMISESVFFHMHRLTWYRIDQLMIEINILQETPIL